MKENIDHLYNRKLKGVETRPPDEVWKNISARLSQKESRKRVVPLWYKFGGVAAALALFIFLGKSLNFSSGETELQIVWEDPSEEIKNGFLNFDLSNDEMEGTTRLLENLILENKNYATTSVGNNRTIARSSKTRESIFEKILNEPAFSTVSTTGYSFAEHNNHAFQQEMEHQQQVQQEIEKDSITGDLAMLEDAQDTSEKEKLQNPKMSNRLSLRPTAGAVYSSNMGSGNSIDSKYANNRTTGGISMAYGVQLAYQITERVKFRSGVNKLGLNYNIQNVDFVSALTSSALGSSVSFGNIPVTINANSLASSTSSQLNQRMGFIEVPFEFEFTLSDKKLGLNLIAGGSTLFLDNNMISHNSNEFSTNLGQAQNINDISYSANIGIGLNYNISSRFLWNLEPLFKYQINTFKNTSDVNPYYLGLYSGFTYKF